MLAQKAFYLDGGICCCFRIVFQDVTLIYHIYPLKSECMGSIWIYLQNHLMLIFLRQNHVRAICCRAPIVLFTYEYQQRGIVAGQL